MLSVGEPVTATTPPLRVNETVPPITLRFPDQVVVALLLRVKVPAVVASMVPPAAFTTSGRDVVMADVGNSVPPANVRADVLEPRLLSAATFTVPALMV